MRRIRKISGIDRQVPVLKEDSAGRIVTKGGRQSHKVSRVSVKPENIPSVVKRDVNMNFENKKKTISRIEPIWAGETVYIIGGGPSLTDFDWKGLMGKKTIAINKAILSYPKADILYWTDSRVYGWHKNEINRFKGNKYTIRHHTSYPEDIQVLRKGEKFGLSEAKDTLCHGNNSGYAAINLAYLLGAKRIILLGYDMGNDGSKSHYHDGYPVPVTSDKIYRDQFMPGFKVIGDLLKQKGVQVYNASVNSALNVWPKISFEKALSFN